MLAWGEGLNGPEAVVQARTGWKKGCRKTGRGRWCPLGNLLNDCWRAPKAARLAVLCGGQRRLTSQEMSRGRQRRQSARAAADRGLDRCRQWGSPGTGWESRLRHRRDHWRSGCCRTLTREPGAGHWVRADLSPRATDSARHGRWAASCPRSRTQGEPAGAGEARCPAAGPPVDRRKVPAPGHSPRASTARRGLLPSPAVRPPQARSPARSPRTPQGPPAPLTQLRGRLPNPPSCRAPGAGPRGPWAEPQ